MSDDVNLNAYFERIGFSGSIAPTLATLEALTALQPGAIPFENLDSLMGVPVALDQASLNRKLLQGRRGGYCFEQNLLLCRVLEELGFVVHAHAARVLWGGRDGPPSHMALSVDIGATNYLVDVGFGGLTLTAPLKLRSTADQETPHNTFRIVPQDDAFRVEVKIGEGWRPAYSFTLEEPDMARLEAMNAAVTSAPDAEFRTHLMVCRAQKDRQMALFGARLTVYAGGPPETMTLDSLEALRETLAGPFGINLPESDSLDPALTRVLAHDTSGT